MGIAHDLHSLNMFTETEYRHYPVIGKCPTLPKYPTLQLPDAEALYPSCITSTGNSEDKTSEDRRQFLFPNLRLYSFRLIKVSLHKDLISENF